MVADSKPGFPCRVTLEDAEPGERLILYVFVAGMMLPFQILLLPVFRLSDWLGIYDSYLAVIMIHSAFQLGFCTFILRNYMRTIPGEILEAARMDGANDFTILFRIVLPLSMPVVAVMLLFYSVGHWNAWFGAMIYLRTRERQMRGGVRGAV